MTDHDDDHEHIRIPRGEEIVGECPACGEITRLESIACDYGTYALETVDACKHFEDYYKGEFSWKD